MLPIKQFSNYFHENNSINAYNQIQITSKCNAKCIFCSNEQNPFEIERLDFRDPKEIEKVVWATPFINGYIHLNESLPGRISEGEALIHPQLFEILKIIRKKFNNTIVITTNGSLLTEEMIQKLACFKPIEIVISFHSTDRENWKNIFNLGDQQYEIAVNSFNLLNRYKIPINASMVTMPNWLGYNDIEKTLKFFKDNKCNDVIIFSSGYTNYTNKEVVNKLIYDKRELSNFLKMIKEKYHLYIKWPGDPDLPLYINVLYLTDIIKNISISGLEEVYILTSVAAYDRFKILIADINISSPMKLIPVKVENKTYGGNIDCLALWMIDDIRQKIKELNLNNTTIIFSDEFTDKYGFDLMGENLLDFKRECIEKFNINLQIIQTKI